MRLNKLLGELHIDPIEKFISISEAASKRLIGSFNCVDVIPYAKEVFKLIENNSSNVVQFERLSCAAVENNYWNIINTFQCILDAFEEDWEGLVDYYNELF